MKTGQNSKSKVRYTYYKKDAAGNFIPYKAYYNYCSSSVRTYNNHLHLYVELSAAAQYLLRYLVETMDKTDNLVINHPTERDNFIKFMSRSINKKYQDKTVSKAFTELKNTGYLIDLNYAKRLIVNPLYFFNGTKSDRHMYLLKLINLACDPRNKNLDVLNKLGVTIH